MVSFPRFGLNVTSTVVKDTTKRDIRRGEEGKADNESTRRKKEGIGILSLLFSYSFGFLQSSTEEANSYAFLPQPSQRLLF